MRIRRRSTFYTQLLALAATGTVLSAILPAQASSATNVKFPRIISISALPAEVGYQGGEVTILTKQVGASRCQISSTSKRITTRSEHCRNAETRLVLHLPRNSTKSVVHYPVTFTAFNRQGERAKRQLRISVAAHRPASSSGSNGSTGTAGAESSNHASIALGASFVAPGGSLAVSAGGFGSGTLVTLELHSTPEELSTVEVPATGSISTTVQIPTNTPTGSHEIVAIGVSATGAALQETSPIMIGFDSTPPTIPASGQPGAISLSTNSIDTSAGPATVVMNLSVFDDLSGLSTSQVSSVEWTNGTTSIYGCIALSGAMTGGGTCTRTSGTATNGAYTTNVVFPANSPSGLYQIQFINVVDAAGNRRYYYPSDLTSLGYSLSSLNITNS